MKVEGTAIVLGASTGTGASIAARLRERYGHVIGFHRGYHQQEADTLQRDWGVNMIVQDVGSDVSCVRAGVETVRHCGAVDVLVHSLSGATVGNALDTKPEKVVSTFARMAHSFLWWAQMLHAQGLLAPRARLIALSNPVADHYLRNSGVIGAAKAALEAYVRMLAVELGRQGHIVAGVRFGAVVTPALEKVVPKAREQLTALHQHISPFGELQTPGDVSHFVALLATLYGMRGLNGAIVDFTNGAHLTLMDYAFNSRAS